MRQLFLALLIGLLLLPAAGAALHDPFDDDTESAYALSPAYWVVNTSGSHMNASRTVTTGTPAMYPNLSGDPSGIFDAVYGPDANYTMVFTFKGVASGQARIGFIFDSVQADDAGSIANGTKYGVIASNRTTGDNIYLYDTTAGVPATLNNTPVQIDRDTPHVLTVLTNATSAEKIAVYLDDVKIISSTSSTRSSGYAGMYQSGGTTWIDDLWLGDATEEPPAAPLPIVAFSASNTTGISPLVVRFTNESIVVDPEANVSYSWTFGDGNTSTEASPLHIYEVAGSHDVTLTVTNLSGVNASTQTDMITVGSGLPTASFVGSPVAGAPPLYVQFNDTSVVEDPLTWDWDFGDETTSEEQNPAHSFDDPGVYTVELTVTNASGSATMVRTNYITVTWANVKTVVATNAPAYWKALPDILQCDGTADQVQIQAAIDAVAAAGGGVVQLSPGDFYYTAPFSTSVYVTVKSGVTLRGQGMGPAVNGGTVIRSDFYETPEGDVNPRRYSNIVTRANTIVRDLNITGTGGLSTYAGAACYNVELENIMVYNISRAIACAVWMHSEQELHDITLRNVWVVDSGCAGFAHGWTDEQTSFSVHDISYYDCHAINCGKFGPYRNSKRLGNTYSTSIPSWTPGFDIKEGSAQYNILYDGCVCQDSYGANWYWEKSTSGSNIVFRNCTSSGAGQAYLRYGGQLMEVGNPSAYGGGYLTPYNSIFENCTSENNYIGFYLNGPAQLYNCSDTGSRIGVLVTSNAGTSVIDNCSFTNTGGHLSDASDGNADGLVTASYRNLFGYTGCPIYYFTSATVSINYCTFASTTVRTQPAIFVQSVSTHQYVSYSTMQNYAYGGYSVLTGLAHARYCSVYPTYIQKWLNFDPQPADNDIVPNFAANVTSGTAPLAVKFTDSSSGTGLFAWNLSTGDGTWYNTTSISQKSPTHTYTAAGTYDVTEYVYGSGGYSFVKKFEYITVGAGTLPPTASFSANATDGDEPLTVQFYDTSTGSPTSWLWQFGDGNTSSARHPVHTYVQAGIYTVNLRATNAGGSSWSNVTQYITVTQAASTAPPIISGNATPDSGEAPLSVQFVGTGENVEDWLWDFDDGTTSDDQNVTHVYYAAGTYDVVLSVTNASGANETTIPVTVTGPPIPALPHANFTANVTDGPIPLAVAFAFTGDCLDPIYMNYNFGDGSAVAWGQDVTHTYTEAGTYTVTLTIGNASGGSVMRKTGYIAASDPADWLDADFVANKTFCRLPNCIVGFMDSSTGPVTNYSWTFGDGGTSDEMNPVHTYRFAGWYTVNLTVSIYGDPSDYERKTRYVLVQVPGGGWWY